MQTNNVYFTQQPDRVIVTAHGDRAIIEFPVGVTEEQTDEGVQWKAETVYSIETKYRGNLRETADRNYTIWLNTAMARNKEEARKLDRITMDDLTEITADQEFRICMLELGVEL